MSAPRFLTRRRALLAGGLTGAGLLLPGCSQVLQGDRMTRSATVQRAFQGVEAWTYHVQRFLIGGGRLAQEFRPQDISPLFRPNGTRLPGSEAYARHKEENFKNWTLTVDGLVARPLSLSLDDIRRLPARTQITRHDCVEGWSAIGQWSGVPLGLLLNTAGLRPGARFVVFHCADILEGDQNSTDPLARGRYYESVDMADALHPQTLIAHSLNGQPLPVANGAPLRLRVERQLGYKHAKYVQRIEVVDSFAKLAGGRGGFWEDRGYEWYAGI
jgi:DMSO/TMAO reductase YedYZ molybdopterin-dependent catalytic subunit